MEKNDNHRDMLVVIVSGVPRSMISSSTHTFMDEIKYLLVYNPVTFKLVLVFRLVYNQCVSRGSVEI